MGTSSADSTRDLDLLPMLGRGKHRSPRKGACFMELASYLAGERWSDRPSCTHRLLAHLARLVNDCSSDAARPRLAPLVPSVIGLRSSDPRWDHEIALLAACHALPVVAEETQRSLAVGALTVDRMLAAIDGREPAEPRRSTAAALAQAPMAARWARRFLEQELAGPARFHPGPVILDFAVPGIATACVPDGDERLHALLTEAITMCRALRDGRDAAQQLPALRPEHWRDLVPAAL